MDGPSTIGLGSTHRRPGLAPPELALIERDEAWKLASAVIGTARAGTGNVLLFEGPAGVGKSGLIAAIRTLARESGIVALSAAGRRRESDFPLGVVVQLFESAEAAGLRPGPIGVHSLERELADQSFAAIHRLYRAYVAYAGESPLVILVDDADLADAPSLRVLLYLAERIHQLPIALVLTAGRVPRVRAPLLLTDIARHPGTLRSRLSVLTAQGTARRLQKTTLSAPVQAAAEEIHLAGGGTPFVVDQLARALAEAEEGNGHGPPEDRLRGLACSGIADWALVLASDVDPAAPALLRAIAVLGGDSELRRVAALAGVDPGPAGAIADLLMDVGLLVQDDRLSFAQPAVASAIERAQTPSERGERNLRAANILNEEGEPAERVADVLLRASRMGSAATVEALSMAAAVALGRADPSRAVRYLARALDEPPPPDMRAHLVLELGRAEAMAGHPDAADHLAAGLSESTHGPQDPAEALVAGRTLSALGRTEEALAMFERALNQPPDGHAGTVARLAVAIRTAQWLTGVTDGTRPELPEPEWGAQTPAARASLALHAVDGTLRGRPAAEVRHLAEHALGGGALLDEETSEGSTYYLAALALVFAGDLQMAEAALTAALHDAQSRGSVLGFATASRVRSMAILKRGRLSDAALDARCALAAALAAQHRGAGTAHTVLARTAMERGDLEAAERHLDVAEAASTNGDGSILSILSVRGTLALYAGDAELAFRLFMDCGNHADRAGIVNPAVVGWRASAGRATAVIGDRRAAEQMVEAELSLAHEFGEPAAIGRALCALGSVREPRAALEAYEAGVEALQSSQAALDRARGLVDYGAALRRAGHRRDSREPLREGLDLAERCGATALVARARSEAKVAGARPRRTALSGADALTARERQVAALAAQGLANRAIAEKLVVSIKTVEWHLKNSFMKLGVTSRTELPGKLSESGPL